MLTLDQIKTKMKPLSVQQVARDCGLHPNTIYGIVNGRTNPSYQAVKTLSDYLERLYSSEGTYNA